MLRRAAVALLTVAVLGMTAGAPSFGDAPGLTSLLNFETRPAKQLSRIEPTPVWAEIAGGYRSDDGSQLPATKEIRLLVDRHLRLDLAGVPGCGGSGIRSDVRRSPAEIEALCPESIVGRGEISVAVEFPGQPRLKAHGRLALFKADESSEGELVALAFLPAPVTAAIPIPIDVRRVSGSRLGWEARASIPKIAGGYGSLRDYSLRLGKRFLSATCVGGKLELQALSRFVDGTVARKPAVQRCAAAKPDPRQ